VKPTVISAEALFEEHRPALHWEWIAGHAHPERRFDEAAVRNAQSAADLVGYLNYIHPYRVQIVGVREVAYLMNSLPEDQERRIQRIVTLEPPVVIVADGQQPPERLVAMCDRADIPLFVTAESAGQVIDVVRGHLAQHFAERTTRHGVCMDILADDAVDLYRVSQTSLEGRCPELLMNLLEVRGIGLLDIKAIFGETAVRRKMRLKLIVHLVRKETMERDFERLPYEPLYEEILDVPVRKAVIAVDAGRNLAVLVEAAVRNTILQLRGIDTYQEFIARHQKAMASGGNH
jgi:HPr kinase/phosphorylase